MAEIKVIYQVDAETLADMVISIIKRKALTEIETEKEEIRNRTKQLSGQAQIARYLGISKNYLSTLRKKDVFSQKALWQDGKGGKLYADPEIARQEWESFRSK